MTEELPEDAREEAPADEEVEEQPDEGGDTQTQEQSDRETVERRSRFRLNKILGAELEYGGEVTRARLFVIDISASGFKATNHSALPVDEDLGVKIALSQKQEPIEATARVVWQKELSLSGMFQCGFQFLEMADESQTRLEEFIEAERLKAQAPKESVYLGRPWTPIK